MLFIEAIHIVFLKFKITEKRLWGLQGNLKIVNRFSD